MINNFRHVEITAQDKPVTVSQMRNLMADYYLLKYIHRAVVWSHSWDVSSPGLTNEDYASPLVWIPDGVTNIKMQVILYRTAAADDMTLDLRIGPQYITDDIPISNGWNYKVIDIDWSESLSGQYHDIQWNKTGFVSAWYYVGFIATNSDAVNYVSPSLTELADSNFIRSIAQKLNDMNSQPMFIGGTWTPHTVVSRVDTTLQYRHYAQITHADNRLTEESEYSVKALGAATGVGSWACELTADHANSGDSATTNYQSYTTKQLTLPVLSGSSYESTSAVRINAKGIAGAGSTYDPIVDSLGIWIRDKLPYSDNRKQGSYRTAVDSSYFDVKSDSTVDYDTINSLGLALTNNYRNRLGALASFMVPTGKTITLTTSYQTICYLGQWVPNPWDVNENALNDIVVYLGFVIKNNTATARTITYNLTNIPTSDTVSGAFTAGASTTTYAKVGGIITIGGAGTESYKLELKASASVSVTIFSVTLGRLGK